MQASIDLVPKTKVRIVAGDEPSHPQEGTFLSRVSELPNYQEREQNMWQLGQMIAASN